MKTYSRTRLLEAALGLIALRGLDSFTASEFRELWRQAKTDLEMSRPRNAVAYRPSEILAGLRLLGWISIVSQDTAGRNSYRCHYEITEAGLERLEYIDCKWMQA